MVLKHERKTLGHAVVFLLVMLASPAISNDFGILTRMLYAAFLAEQGVAVWARLLPLIEWEPTDKGNVRVLNDTGDYYRFFDATPHAEFLYECVERTIEVDLPAETSFLKGYDSFRRQVEDLVDMPDNTVDLLFRFLRQNDGRLSRRAREREFAELTEDEVAKIDAAYAKAFSG